MILIIAPLFLRKLHHPARLEAYCSILMVHNLKIGLYEIISDIANSRSDCTDVDELE